MDDTMTPEQQPEMPAEGGNETEGGNEEQAA